MKNIKQYKLIAAFVLALVLAFPGPVRIFAAWPQETDFTDKVETISDAVFMIEVNSGRVLYSKNSRMRVYPASTIKVLTALIAVENASLDEMVTVSYEATRLPYGYTALPLYEGEQMSMLDCLYGMLVLSANDCAKAIAEHVGGSISGFAEMMNRKAEELGCRDSHFVTPYGEFGYDHYSTAYDMYLITKAAFDNSIVAKIACTHEVWLDPTNISGGRYITCKNYLTDPSGAYYNPDVVASKTGNVDTGRCLVTLSSHGNAKIVTVCMHSSEYSGVFYDTDALLEYAENNVDMIRQAEDESFPGDLDIQKTFTDVPEEGVSYYRPVYWAVRENIIKGFDDGSFRPDDSCTRAQFAMMMWRMAGRPKESSAEAAFPDVDSSSSVYQAVSWAASGGIVKGFDDGSFRPDEPLTRRQIVVMLWRLLDRPEIYGRMPFSDVPANESTAPAVLWASQAGMVSGYPDGRFEPEENCTRAQIVVILYRGVRSGLLV